MNQKKLGLILVVTSVLCTSMTMADQSPGGKNAAEQKVLDFVSAFNQKDVDAMLTLASADVTWMSISGAKIIEDAGGAESLKSSMQDYFSTYPTSFSVIEQVQSSGPWVTTLERAGRKIDGQFKGQCTYAMYRLVNGLVQSVWYFPAHPCDTE